MDAAFSAAGFWDFVASRHRIWVKRQEGQPPPWTDDPILQEFHFCNVYRELDAGTQWYLEHVVPKPDASFDFVDALWRTITYRLVNNSEIFEQLGGVAGYRGWRDMIREMHVRDIKLYSRAYQTLPRPAGSISRARRLEFILNRLDANIKQLALDIYQAETLEEVSQHLKAQYGVGPFVTMQVYRDLILAGVLPFPDEDWVEVGPGAAWLLIRMYGVGDTSGRFLGANSPGKQKVWREKIEELRSSQRDPLLERGFCHLNSQVLTACDIEHCLCEAGKYHKIRMWLEGEGPCPRLRYRGTKGRQAIGKEWRRYRASVQR